MTPAEWDQFVVDYLTIEIRGLLQIQTFALLNVPVEMCRLCGRPLHDVGMALNCLVGTNFGMFHRHCYEAVIAQARDAHEAGALVRAAMAAQAERLM